MASVTEDPNFKFHLILIHSNLKRLRWLEATVLDNRALDLRLCVPHLVEQAVLLAFRIRVIREVISHTGNEKELIASDFP